MKNKEYSLEIGGKKLTAHFNDLAEQAHGSVMLSYGETIVLATACMSKDKQEGLGYFNLTVDYVEKFYASGKISGSRFLKREGRPSEEAVLGSRVIDRTLRPLFDNKIRHAVQVIVTVISVDDNDPVILAINAASLALLTSDIPWAGPVGAVRIGKYDTENLEINAVKQKREEDVLYKHDLTVCGKDGNINMIEASGREVSEEDLKNSLEIASKEISKLEEFQKQIAKEIGKEKRIIEEEKIKDEILEFFNQNILPKMKTALFSLSGRKEINDLKDVWKKEIKDFYKKINEEKKDFTLEDNLFYEAENKILHDSALLENKRADGRGMDEVREIYAKAGGLSTILHGSGIFYRGGTHMLTLLTLGGPEDRNLIDSMQTSTEKRFMHHYNFPPYSAGEVGRFGFTNRREVGHGALAEKALLMVLPNKESFPYTIRLVSESMASNGSTSQAAICASSLALMDGGVPISSPVAGVAIGLMYEDVNSYKILTDIQGPEDHHGDMDFKVAGTKKGVTAIQLDVKVEGVPIKILSEALLKAKDARIKILEEMEKEIKEARPEISPNAPKILIIKINKNKIGLVIGSGGKTIKEIKEKTGAEITIEDDGTVYFTGIGDSTEKAKKIVEEMTYEFKKGDEAEGEVVKILDFGIFVKLNEYTEGMVHISELAPFRVNKISDIIKEGMIVPVKVINIDEERDKISLSIKECNKNFFKNGGEQK